MEYHRLSGLKTTEMYFHIFKAEKAKIKVPADLVPGENLLPGSEKVVFLL